MTKTYDFSSNGPPDTAISELNLIRFSQQGDRDAFACLYDTYLERIHRYVFFRVIDPEVAEDITSLVFLRVWENMDTFKTGRSTFLRWLYRIAHNAVVDHYRTRRVVISLDEVDPAKLGHSDDVDEKLERKVRTQELAEALKELTDVQREVLLLRFIVGLTTMEIAHKLHKREGAVRAVQMRGLKRLADMLPSQ